MKVNNIISLCMLACALLSCKDDTTTPIQTPNLIGEWHWVKTCGGISASTIITPESSGHNMSYTFTSNNKLTMKYDGQIKYIYDYKFKRDLSQLTQDSANFIIVSHVVNLNNKDSIINDYQYRYQFNKDSLIISSEFVDAQSEYYVK